MYTAGVERLNISKDGFLTIGSSQLAGAVASFVNSNGTCTVNPNSSSLSCSSDERLKKNIVTVASDLGMLLALNPVSYNWVNEFDGTPAHTGFIAQQVKELFPDLVSVDAATGMYSLNYAGLVPYIVKAIKDMQGSINTVDASTSTPTLISKFQGHTGDDLPAIMVDTNGNIGIGMSNPLSRFQVAGDVRLGVASSTAGNLLFQNDSNAYTTTLRSATSTLSSDVTFTLPSGLGNARETLMTDGTGQMYWGAVAKIANNASTTVGYAVRWLPDGEVASGILMDDGLVTGVNATSTSAFTVAQATSTQSAFSVLSSVKDMFFSVDATGMVSVGTSTSGSRFDIFDKTDDASKDLFRVVSNVGMENDVKFRISASGDLFAAGSLSIGVGAGITESYTPTEAVDSGTVVAFATTTTPWLQTTATGTESYDIAGVRKAVTDAEAIGVVSTYTGISLATKTQNGVPVAFVGRVPVKVTTEAGIVKTGDYLTVSKTVPGSAMKLVGEGRSIGRAISDYTQGREKVMIIIDNQNLMLDMEGRFATTTKMLTTGNVDLNANGVSIINIKSLVSASGAWSIDESGRLITRVLCLEDVCINKNELRNLLINSGQGNGQGNTTSTNTGTTTTENGTGSPSGEVAGVSTTTEEGGPSPTSTEEILSDSPPPDSEPPVPQGDGNSPL